MFVSRSSEKAGSTKGISCTLASWPRLLPVVYDCSGCFRAMRPPNPQLGVWLGYFKRFCSLTFNSSRRPAGLHGAIWSDRFFYSHRGCCRRYACKALHRSPGYRRPLRYPVVLLQHPAFHLHLFLTMGGVTILAFSSVKPAFTIHLRLWVFAARQGGLLHHIVVNNIDDHFGHFQHIFRGCVWCIVTHSPGG